MEQSAAVFKRCRCGRIYSATEWARLALVGFMQNGRDAAGELLELRQCPCGSSITIDHGDEPDSVPRMKLDSTP